MGRQIAVKSPGQQFGGARIYGFFHGGGGGLNEFINFGPLPFGAVVKGLVMNTYQDASEMTSNSFRVTVGTEAATDDGEMDAQEHLTRSTALGTFAENTVPLAPADGQGYFPINIVADDVDRFVNVEVRSTAFGEMMGSVAIVLE